MKSLDFRYIFGTFLQTGMFAYFNILAGLNHHKATHHILSSVDNITKVPSPATSQKNNDPPLKLTPLKKQDNGIKKTATITSTAQNPNTSQEISEDVKIGSQIIKEKADFIHHVVCSQRGFHLGSFIGGMALIIVLNVICILGIRFYKGRGSRNYNYLLWGESSN
jgi:hypothetical protein